MFYIPSRLQLARLRWDVEEAGRLQRDRERAMSQGHDYTLELEDWCFYVRHSLDVETRIAAHFLGKGAGAKWTNLHPPLRVLSVVPGDTLLENLTTIALMVQHGNACVRGGKLGRARTQMPCQHPKGHVHHATGRPARRKRRRGGREAAPNTRNK